MVKTFCSQTYMNKLRADAMLHFIQDCVTDSGSDDGADAMLGLIQDCITDSADAILQLIQD